MWLLIDHYDSFTFNIAQPLWALGVDLEICPPTLSISMLLEKQPEGLIFGPGPGHPLKAALACTFFIHKIPIPTLGICLGHQVLGVSFGAGIQKAHVPMHGKCSQVFHDGDPLFKGVGCAFQAMRYHSLVVSSERLPEDLKVIAQTEHQEIMALRHKTLPYWGVQFHPDSFMTEEGNQILENFLCIASLERKVMPQVDTTSLLAFA